MRLTLCLTAVLALTACDTDDRVSCADISLGDDIGKYELLDYPPFTSVGLDLLGDCNEWRYSWPDDHEWESVDARPPAPAESNYDHCSLPSSYQCAAFVDSERKVLCVKEHCD